MGNQELSTACTTGLEETRWDPLFLGRAGGHLSRQLEEITNELLLRHLDIKLTIEEGDFPITRMNNRYQPEGDPDHHRQAV